MTQIRKSLAIASMLIIAFASGCQSGSAIVTGHTRSPVAKESVKLYLTPPQKYEVIGLVEATGKSGWTAQAKMDRAIGELKEHAAKLGANGILLSSSGDKSGGIAGVTNNGLFYGGNVDYKSVSGQAIYVTEE